MGGDDETSSNTSKKGDEAFAQRKAGINKDELNEHLREYINEWKKQRSKDEEELKRLKEKQMKRKEQVEEEMKISLSFRIKPLDLESMDSDELKGKATELFNTILLLETEKYDCEQRRINQDYELKELKERQKVQLRQKAAKKGLDPEAFTGKYPPRIRMFSKYERRT